VLQGPAKHWYTQSLPVLLLLTQFARADAGSLIGSSICIQIVNCGLFAQLMMNVELIEAQCSVKRHFDKVKK
jgi:hypothetical protein